MGKSRKVRVTLKTGQFTNFAADYSRGSEMPFTKQRIFQDTGP